jgi:hypothetical protein
MKLKSVFLLNVLLFYSFASFATEKTDIVILKNGDRVTGEIKSLEAGLLQVKTDTMGMIYIEWRFISELISELNQSVESADGRRWLGKLQKPETGEHIVVNTGGGPVDLSTTEVVTVWPVAATFLDKVDLDVSLGFDYSKSTDITNFNLGVNFQHRSDNRLTEGFLRSDITRQQAGDDQNRQEIILSQQFLRSEQKFRTWVVGLDSNDALGVDLRLFGGGAIGKYLIKTNNKWLSVSGGLLVTQENPQEAESENNLEGVFSGRYRFFRYATPERTFDTTLTLFPSVTDFGRVRTNLRSTFKLEFIEDLFWSMELYATHDSHPLSEDAEKTDYGLITGIGWSY